MNAVKKKALLVVSFGTSYIDSRIASIDATEAALSEAFPDYDKFTAFTSQRIIKIYKDRDKYEYDNVWEAMERIRNRGYEEVLILPTHVINGEEYGKVLKAAEAYKDTFNSMTISTPLLTKAEDYEQLAMAIAAELPELDDKTAVVLMGHGTSHAANSAYPALDYIFKHKINEHIYVGTVEGRPELEDVLLDFEDKNYRNVILMPLMIVAGDHAHNDMAGGEGSWRSVFEAKGYLVTCIMKGLGEMSAVQELFAVHGKRALAKI